MKFVPIYLSLPLLSLLSTSYATESIHLSQCQSTWDNGSVTFSSEIDYYADDSTSYSDVIPLSENICLTSDYGLILWEGTIISCTFESGVTVTTHIDSDGENVALYTYAGWITNGFKTFNCNRDDYRQLYSTGFGNGNTFCDSAFYCLPA